MAVITEEIDAGDMAAMPTVDVAGGLGKRDTEGDQCQANYLELESARILHSSFHPFFLGLLSSSAGHGHRRDTEMNHTEPLVPSA